MVERSQDRGEERPTGMNWEATRRLAYHLCLERINENIRSFFAPRNDVDVVFRGLEQSYMFMLRAPFHCNGRIWSDADGTPFIAPPGGRIEIG